jgi:DNA-binding NarL/FixJ family response regulator
VETTGEAGRPIRVLLAEDQRLFAEGVMALLSAHDRIDVVGCAVTGEEAVELARAYRPDLVLMDISMPGMDGIEATRRVKQALPSTAVLVLTASEAREDVERAAEAGADGYLTKDTASSDLIGAIVEIGSLATAVGRSAVRE